MWSRHVHALLDGYDLADYIDGSTVAPSSTITTDEGIVPNPAYAIWKRQYRLIYSALLGAITTTVQPILSTASTVTQRSGLFSMTYAKPSRGHVKQLRQQLHNLKKGSKSINEYIQGFTTRFDELALLGESLDHEDQIEFVLDGLPEDYKTTADQVEGRDTAPSLAEIHEKLLNQEAKLQSTPVSTHSAHVTAKFANSRGSGNSQNHNQRCGGYRGNQNWQQHQLSPTSNQSTPRGYQVRYAVSTVIAHTDALNFMVLARCNQLNKDTFQDLRRGNQEPMLHKLLSTIPILVA